MIAMVASLFAAFSCMGCLSTEGGAQLETLQPKTIEVNTDIVSPSRLSDSSAHKSWSVSSPVRHGAFAPIDWASNTQTYQHKANFDISPRAIKEAVHETYAASWEFKAPAKKTGLGWDISITPRASVEKRGLSESRRAGAEVRLGQIADEIDQRGKNIKVDNWYMFVGADGEALCWDVGDKGASFDGIALRDQLTVGDLQAGVAFHKGGGELSFGYMRRETRFEDITTVDDIAALSFTMRR